MREYINLILRRSPAETLYFGIGLWAIWYLVQGITGQLGPDPVRVLEHQYGQVALYLLVIGLSVTPLRRSAGINALKFRRSLGVMAGVLVLMHFIVWLILDMQSMDKALAEMFKRRHLVFGVIAVALMLPLLVTSNNWSVRRLGAGWRALHRLTYPLVPIAVLHYLLSTKTIELSAIILMMLTGAMLVMRLQWAIK